MGCERLAELKRRLNKAERKRILKLARSGRVIADEADREKVQIVLDCFLFLPPDVSRRRERMNLLTVVAISFGFVAYFAGDYPDRFTGPVAVGAVVILFCLFLFRTWLVRRYEQTARANGWRHPGDQPS